MTRIRRFLGLAAILSSLSTAAGAQAVPETDWRTPPRAFLVVAPLTAFPDPIALSAAFNPTPTLTAEAGVTAIAPGAFARAGVAIPFRASRQDGSDLLLMAGYRGVVIPAIHGTYYIGPTASVAVRSWPRAGGWGWQLNVGGWYALRPRQDCVGGHGCGGAMDARILPEVRLAAIRWR